MKLKNLFPVFLLISSCATLNDSMMLGATVGGIAGVAATQTAYSKTGQDIPHGELTNSAAVGVAVGLLVSYLIHKDVAGKRGDLSSNGPEIYFGDLPPSPFIMTPVTKKKGGK